VTLVLPGSGDRAGPEPVVVPLGASLAALESTIASVWTTLATAATREGRGRLAFVSARHGEGTTTLASCAAVGLARFTKQSVLLVEGNASSPGLVGKFGLVGVPSLHDVVAGRRPAREALSMTDVPQLRLLLLGPGGASGPLSVGRPEWSELVAELAEEAAFMILDGAPFLDRPEGRMLIEPFRRVVAVARAGSANRDDVQQLILGLCRGGLEPVGAVLNRYG
jgi:MinD-like ATPase involved in chromosome partitioning or flagellar assembly